MPLPIESCHVPQISLTCCNGCCDTSTLHFYGVTLMVTTTWNKDAGKTSRYFVAGSWIPFGCDSILSKGRASLPGYFSVLREEGAAWPVCPSSVLWPLVDHQDCCINLCQSVIWAHCWARVLSWHLALLWLREVCPGDIQELSLSFG